VVSLRGNGINLRAEAEQQVNGFSGAMHRSFRTEADAREWFLANSPRSSTSMRTGGGVARINPAGAELRPNEPPPQNFSIQSVLPTDRPPNPFNIDTITLEHVGSDPALQINRYTSETAPDDTPLRRQLSIPSDAVIIYTDGACPDNGTLAGRAGIGVFFGLNNPRNVSARLPMKIQQTNQRAELFATITALKILRDIGNSTTGYYILTDSMYVIKGITEWSVNWERTGWRTAKGTKVVSSELFKLARTLLADLHQRGIRVRFRHVLGHAGVYGNEMADKLAVDGARKREILDDKDWDSEYDDPEADQMAAELDI